MISAKTKMCVIIGDPVEHSLSPAMHNAAYAKLGIDDQFVFTAAKVKVENVKQVVAAVRVMNIRGLTCTIPHKLEVMKYLDELDETAKKIGAVNTVVNDNGQLKGYNTDWLGVTTPLEKITSLKGKQVALIGAGGAARAVIYGVLQRGGKVTIFNRTLETAQELTKKFGCQALPIEELDKVKTMDIIFNATSVGLYPKVNDTPLPKEYITKKHIVFDAVYNPLETQLLKDAKDIGATIIHGYEMLLYQGTAQFALYTGQKAPEDIMRKVLEKSLHI